MEPRSLALASALGAAFFLVTATTFASLGVVLPAMIAEFHWSWTTAGLGFTLLALMTGIFSPIAATSLRLLGPRLHYVIAGVAMIGGYLLLGAARDAFTYIAATALLGAAFALLANVPGTYLVGRATPEKWRSMAIGAYLAAGGAGGVAGPLMANALIEGGADWRGYWRISAAAVAAVSVLIAVCATRAGPTDRDEKSASPEGAGNLDWTRNSAMRTAAFAIIAAALTVTYFCGVTVSTWSVAHLQKAGLSTSAAVSMLSLYAASNALARAAGGLTVKIVSARLLLIAALLADAIGMTALALAKTIEAATVFALFDGFAFGMALFATTALLIDYFGIKNSPALLGAANLAATIAMIGPTLAGKTADLWGSFSPIFVIYAGAALIAAAAVAMMRDPNLAPTSFPAQACRVNRG